jgi:hypothetical protein
MACIASKRRTIRLALVGSESITESIMGYVSHGQVGQWGIRTKVIGMASPASHARFFLQLVSMERGWIPLLGSDIRMA